MITILDYGMGNLGSVANMLKKTGISSLVTSDINKIKDATKLILPGVGAFDKAIQRIDENGYRDIINELALIKNIPILGICLGMQLLMDGSDEGELKGLGLIAGRAHHFNKVIDNGFKVPHMGWNTITSYEKSRMTLNLDREIRFYFVHSYYVKVTNEADSIMKSMYGIEFDAAVQHKNIFGCQFHPEKSHRFGMQFLKNFTEI